MTAFLIVLFLCVCSLAQEEFTPVVEACFVNDIKKKKEEVCPNLDNDGDSVWRLIPYKERFPFIFNVESRCKECFFQESIALNFDEKFSSWCTYSYSTISVGSNGNSYWQSFDKNINLIERTNFEFLKFDNDGEKRSLQPYLEKEYFVKWKYAFFTGTQEQEFKSKIPIYISGFCTEEQLKQATELKEKLAQERKIRERIEKEIRKEMTGEEE